MAETSPNFSYQVGGSLPVNSPTYIYRQADEQFYQGLKAGEFCYVLNSRQMGKSSLRVQTMQRLQAENIVCAAIDLTAIGTSDITAEEWYAGLIDSIVSSLNLYDHFDLDEWWTKNQRLSNVRRWNKFVESVLLPGIQQKIVIFIDEIDSILRLNFNVDDFFASIRACYNKRAEQPDFNRLTFALLGVATPNDLITNQNHSTPFNIGQAIELTGFQFEEAKPLALGFVQKSANPEIVLQEILNWTGGQPFLTQKVCQLVRLSDEIIPEGEEKEWVEKLVRSRIIENWEAQDEPEHLRTIRDRLLWGSKHSEELLKLYSQILTSESTLCKETKKYLELRLTGIVIKSKEKVKVCNPIYLEIFNLLWLEDLGINTKTQSLPTNQQWEILRLDQVDWQNTRLILSQNLLPKNFVFETFIFETLNINLKGEIIKRETRQAQYFTEDLGEGITLEMVYVPGGTFLMGNSNSRYRSSPVHQVTIEPFFMGKYPITQRQWQAICQLPIPKYIKSLYLRPSQFQGDNHPVEKISWYQAVEFCARLTQHTGKNYRLPSEAEWEYACRAGTGTPFYFGETITTDLANYDGNYTFANAPQGIYRDATTPVDAFPPNAFGLYDLHGNVWEWCADPWHDNYEGAPTNGSVWDESPLGFDYQRYEGVNLSAHFFTHLLNKEFFRCLRGGSWFQEPIYCQSSYRYLYAPNRSDDTGFRVCCAAKGFLNI